MKTLSVLHPSLLRLFPSPLYSGEKGRGEGEQVVCKSGEFSQGRQSPLTPFLSPRVQGERGGATTYSNGEPGNEGLFAHLSVTVHDVFVGA